MKDLVIIIVKYLRKELEENRLSPDAAEAVEVAVQCLENAYSISPDNLGACTMALEDLYHAASYSAEDGRQVTPEQKEEAERLKLAGNKLMQESRYLEAIEHYTRAIGLDPKNTVYFCNRAAAHIQTQNFLGAINDCHEAIRLDPSYSKAHSRLGYAYQAVGNRIKARECYSKALDLEPENESYRSCYQKLQDQGTSDTGPFSELFPGFDVSAIMKNPLFIQMASQMLEDQGMQNAVTRILSGQSPLPVVQVEDLINAGQHLADQLQSQIDTQQEGSSTNGRTPGGMGDNEVQMANQEPTTEQLPSSSSLPTPPAGFGPESTSAQNSVGVSGDGPSSSGLLGKDGQDHCDVDRSNGRDGAN
ncbi:small glutamine-rich tetratricopeptide repeat-containing protein alpha-like [Hetaerina americana]|uniref:small glutamine-rich tetratricopeptide repeat-containing protein alpha-like n=1 Tax=Hetaerina americana TaxID=62018 RepID=UPI003A7F47B4